MKITPLEAAVGAEVSDVDVRDLDATSAAELADAWARHGVLFLRDQHLTPEEHVEFAERFASIDINKFFTAVEGHPKVAQVLKEADQEGNIGGGWHTDHSYDEIPARGSILHALEIPPAGGDTRFLSVGAAYAALAELTELPEPVVEALETHQPGFAQRCEEVGAGVAFQDALCRLEAHHSNEHIFGAEAAHAKEREGRLGNPDGVGSTVHPVIVAHPSTGQPLLYVNMAFTTTFVGWEREASDQLFRFLLSFICDGGFDTQFAWAPGSIAMWDNRSTWHWALNDYQGHRRLLHRITISGEPLSAAPSPLLTA